MKNKLEKKLAILMAVYNGEAFLKQQIISIQEQTFEDWDLIIRDDGSTDMTESILNEMALTDSRINIITDDRKRGGPLNNFKTLMNFATDYEYIMFADQDDIWFKNKIASSLKKITEINGNVKYRAVYTNYQVGEDSNSHHLEREYNEAIINKNNEKHILIQNWLMGCTMIINHDLLILARDIPSEAENHDNWIAILAFMYGNVKYISEPTMFHRIHNNNVTTSRTTKSLQKRLLFMRQEIMNAKKEHHNRLALCKKIDKIDVNMNTNSRVVFDDYKRLLSKSGINGIIFAMRKGFKAYNTKRLLLLYSQVLVWKLK